MQDKSELKDGIVSIKRAKLETPYDSGDCGYYALCVGLLYLGIQARANPELANKINSSEALSNLLLNMPNIARLFDSDNLKYLNKILRELGSKRWDKITFKELLSEFSNGIRRTLANSDWGLNYFKTILKEAGWIIDNHKWMGLPCFKRLNSKIFEEMETLSQDKVVSIEEAGELRFQATLKVFSELQDGVLEDMAKNVVQTYYGPGSEKAWLDSEFLKYLSQQLIPSDENLFFNQHGVEISSQGPSKIHWYIDVPENDITDLLLNIVNSGHSKDLKKIEVYTVRNKSLDEVTFLLQEQEELLQTQKRLIRDFERSIFTLQDHMRAQNIDSRLFSEEMFDMVSKLAHTPNQAAIDDAIIPIIALDESYINEYQSLSTVEKYLTDIDEKIKDNERKLGLKGPGATGEALSNLGLFNTTNEIPKPLEKSKELPGAEPSNFNTATETPETLEKKIEASGIDKLP